MKKFLLSMTVFAMAAMALQARTVVVYYSFTNNCRTIAGELKSQLQDADVVEIQPAEEGVDYAANNYAVGSALISAIRNHPNDASSYPAIKDVAVDFSRYDDVVIVVPLWWSSVAAPMQTFLFQNGKNMEGKKIGLVVSSASSGISGVEADAKRLVPQGDFSKSLWIRSSQTSSCRSMVANWIAQTGIGTVTGISSVKEENQTKISVNGKTLTVSGDFESVEIYDAAGRKLISSTTGATEIHKLNGANVYVAVVKGSNSVKSYKFSVR